MADLLERPDEAHAIGRRDSQLLFGEPFEMISEEGDFAFGKSLIDNYSGYTRKASLSAALENKTHTVCVLSTHLYPEPSFKSRPLMPLSFLSRVSLKDAPAQNGFVETLAHGWVWLDHLQDIGEKEDVSGIIATALMFIGTPYLYSGRSAFGIDCSGLVQVIANAHGVSCPRDADMQEGKLGASVPFGDSMTPSGLQAGDFVYFEHHTGIMLDERRILNATARHMSVVIEDIRDLAKIYQGVRSVRRLPSGNY